MAMPPSGEAPADIAGFDSLSELALNLRWSWNHATDLLWRELDPIQWQLTRNPWAVLQTVSRETLNRALAVPQFRNRIDELVRERRRAMAAPAWFQQTHPSVALGGIAYFSMEYMLSEALPIYSGGLGNVAGDHLKAASDLGVPLVGVGLLYAQGYFRQVIDRTGAQQALFPYNDPGQLPVAPLRNAAGEWLRLRITLPGYSIWLRTWRVQVGTVSLYLLDSNDIANLPGFRGITSELYGGGPELRLQQELVLGIGGWRLLNALNLRPDVCHLNEGHAAFAILERARTFMEASGQPFDSALAATRAGNIFTTHTAVPAGFDCFPPELIERYLGHYANTALNLSMRELLALGRRQADDAAEPFNMAYLSVRGCGGVNGVSRLHGEVSRGIFQPLFPRWPSQEVPIGHVTNGVHTPSWDGAEADALWTASCGKDRWLGTLDSMTARVRGMSDADLWTCRTAARNSLIDYVRDRLSLQFAASGMSLGEIEWARHAFEADALTLGFARRFATYKRPDLLLQDRDRLTRMLTSKTQPVQLILAGKAHPADVAGQALIQEWIRFIRRPEVRGHVMFLSDYDMLLTERLVQGVDVWINTPQRPWEACGTSGMKVLVNGGLNLSALDGWWAEAYAPNLGWAFGDSGDHGGDPARNARDASELFDVLERQVIPEFYARDAGGRPHAWIGRVRESMATLTPTYSANRSLRQYVEQCYLPAAAAYRARAENQGALGGKIATWQRALDQAWPTLTIGRAVISPCGKDYEYTVEVGFGSVDPQWVLIELYADPQGAGGAFRRTMTRVAGGGVAEGRALYAARAPATRPSSDYCARILPDFPGVSVPLENGRVSWER